MSQRTKYRYWQTFFKKVFKKRNFLFVKVFFLICFTLLFFNTSFSQLPSFNWVSISKATDPLQIGEESLFHDIVEDDSENIIVCGGYRGTVQFGQGATAVTRTSGPKTFHPNKDIVILKMNAFGDLLWDITIGDNSNHNIARTLDVDDSGNIYVSGVFEGIVDFDPSNNVHNLQSTSTAGGDIFVAKYSANGQFIWAFAIQGNHWRQDAYDIDVNSTSGHFILGVELNTPVDVDPLNSTNTSFSTSGEDAAILVYDLSGNFIFGQNYNDSSSSGISAVYMEDDGDSYVFVGAENGIGDIDPTSNVVNISDNKVGVLIKYDISGNLIWYQIYNVSNNHIYASGIEIDQCGDIVIAGTYYELVPSNSYEAFVAKFDSTGNMLWDEKSSSSNGNTFLGSVPFGEFRNGGLAVDKNNNVYIIGSTGNTNFSVNMTFGSSSISNNGGGGYFGYMTKFDSDGNSIYLEKIENDGTPYYYNVNTFVSKNNTITITGYGTTSINIPFGGGINGNDDFTNYFINFSQDSTSLNPCEEDCAGVINGTSILDSCGVCLEPSDPNFNQSCTDCAGVINGTSILDSCDVCLESSDPNFNQSCTDCAGVFNGTSILDSCGVCLESSDPNFNQSCTDCAGVINGTSILDSCGVCLESSDPNFNQSCTDCAGVINGNSILDSCDVCLEPSDPNFNQSCTDCAGVINGTSILDSCGVCLESSDPNFNQSCTDCAGVLNGTSILDSCDVCLEPSDPNFNQTCTDCAGVLNGTSILDSCGVCLEPSDPNFNQNCTDCAGVINGNSVLDSCGVCLESSDPNFNQSCTDCAGVLNGTSILDSCGICLEPSDPNFNQNCTDCAGVINGNSVLDSCGVCLEPSAPNFNQSCTDCAGVINGNSILDSCGVCLEPSDPNFNQTCMDCASVINGNSVLDSCGICLEPNDPDFDLSCLENFDVYIPNAFSPNNDGENDNFQAYKDENTEAKINRYLIFGRWGELVYETEDFQFFDEEKWWDGTFNGKKMQTGVYVYYIEIQFGNGALEKYHGDVFLKRY